MQPLTFQDLAYLLSNTPRLRVLSLYIELVDTEEYENVPLIGTSITTLKLVYRGETHLLSNLLQCMPNLHKLIIDLENIKLNGHQWERIIIKSAPQLKIFRFKMSISRHNNKLSDQEIDALLDTFRTPFWFDEHQWYVRCDVEHQCLYTVPYAFHFFSTGAVSLRLIVNAAENIRQAKWTYPDDRKYWLFDRVHRFDCIMQAKNSSYLYPACFPNIQKLELRIPSDDTIWRIIPTFDHLTTLHINVHEKDSGSELQALFDQAPHLYTLTIHFFTTLPELMALFQLKSTSIRRL
jgi:hypothetical protein